MSSSSSNSVGVGNNTVTNNVTTTTTTVNIGEIKYPSNAVPPHLWTAEHRAAVHSKINALKDSARGAGDRQNSTGGGGTTAQTTRAGLGSRGGTPAQPSTRGGQQGGRGNIQNTRGGNQTIRGGNQNTRGGNQNTRGGNTHNTRGGNQNNRGGRGGRGGAFSRGGGRGTSHGPGTRDGNGYQLPSVQQLDPVWGNVAKTLSAQSAYARTDQAYAQLKAEREQQWKDAKEDGGNISRVNFIENYTKREEGSKGDENEGW